MKISEILRGLADELDSADEDELQTTNKLITPLQQKIELLKKATGVESHYDEPEECNDEDDALSKLKQNAGIPVAVVHIASEDNDILG